MKAACGLLLLTRFKFAALPKELHQFKGIDYIVVTCLN